MRKEDIQVCKTYIHTDEWQKGKIFLGVGLRKLYTINDFVDKHLVIISAPRNEDVGLMIQEGENAIPGWWDGFRLAE